MKKICFILSTLNAGGLENYVLRFLKYSSGKYNVTIICLSNENVHLHNDYMELGIKIIFIRLGYYNPVLFFHLYRLLYKNEFDVFCGFSGNLSGPSLLLSNFAKIPIRIAFYRRSSNGFKLSWLRLFYNYICNRLVYNNATNILSNSEYAFKVYFPSEYQNDNRFRVIKNGVDKKIFKFKTKSLENRIQLGISTNAFVIGHVGRFDDSKNHKTIFKVANTILNLFDEVVFVFCGMDTDSNAFIDAVSQIKFSDRIKLLGIQKDVSKVFQLMDLFYFPSLTEGQPNALIEAMLTGLPVVASNIEPIKEALPIYAHSTLLDPLNVKYAVDIISKLIDSPDLRSMYIHKEWAENEFDYYKNLALFQNVIDGY